jgi:Sec-independent protein translocase protein TatA
MFDISFLHLIVVAIVVLLCLGPNELPIVLKFLGHVIVRFKKLTSVISNEISTNAVDSSNLDTQKPPPYTLKNVKRRQYHWIDLPGQHCKKPWL